MGLHGLFQRYLKFLYVYDVHTSQEARLLPSTSCYGDRFTFSYVDDDRTSQETPMGLLGLLRGSFTFLYVGDVRTSQEALVLLRR
jgi:hypothetical protein